MTVRPRDRLLGMPGMPPPAAGSAAQDSRKIKVGTVRRRRRRAGQRAVDDDDADQPTSTRRCSRSPSSPPPAATSSASPCPSQDDADALPEIAKHSQIPVIADIHFQPKYVFAAIDAGCAAVRVNPGNIRQFDDQVGAIAKAAARRRRLDPHRRQRRLARQATAREVRQGHAGGAGRVGRVGGVAVRGARLPRLQDLGQAQRPGRHGRTPTSCSPSAATGRCTSASPRPARPSRARSRASVAFGAPAGRGHRRHDPRLAVRAAGRGGQGRPADPAESLNLRERKLEIVSCPSCGRAQVDVYTLAERVTAGLEGLEVPLRVAVMGCVVNGPGEAREADLGVASRQRQGPDLRQGRGHQDRSGEPDRRDAHRGGHAAGRSHATGRGRSAAGHGVLTPISGVGGLAPGIR